LDDDTACHLRDLVTASRDREEILTAAVDHIDGDPSVSSTLPKIATDCKNISAEIASSITLLSEIATAEGSFSHWQRTIWSALRSDLTSGGGSTVSMEAKRAVDAILARFKELLPRIAGNSINNALLIHFQQSLQGK